MITIGIRAHTKGLIFAVYDSTAGKVVNVEEIRIPAAFGVPDGLKYARNNLLDVLREYKVESAGIRLTESTSKTIRVERVAIEGVVQEAFASSELRGYYTGQIATIASRLGIDRVRFKPMVEDGENDLDIGNWQEMSKEEREAILCAMGAVSDA